MGMTWIVAKREFLVRSRAKSLRVAVVIIALLALVAGAGVRLFMQYQGSETKIALAGEARKLAQPLKLQAAAGQIPLEITEINSSSESEGVDAIEHGIREGTYHYGVAGKAEEPRLYFTGIPTTRVGVLISQASGALALQKLAEETGIEPQRIAGMLAAAQPRLVAVSPTENAGDDTALSPEKIIVSALVLSILLAIILMVGQMVAQSIVEEKTSRIVEVLLSTITATQLLVGKVLGTMAVGVLFTATLGASVAGGMYISGQVPLDLLSQVGGMSLLWLGIGVLMYVFMFAGLGATVSRQEELGAGIAPVTIVLMVPFYLAIYLVPYNPTSVYTIALSHLPPFSPFMMPIRAVTGTLPTWELLVSLAVSIAFTAGAAKLGAVIYRRGVMHTGARLKLSRVLRGNA